jgi:cardiolipin synthase
MDTEADRPRIAPSWAGWEPRRVFEVALGVPASEGNEVLILRNGDEIFPAMLESIDGAELSVDLLTFVYWTGDIARDFAESLASAARRGVRTRVLLDRVGARRIDSGLVELMLEAGCDVQWFRSAGGDAPLVEAAHRTHRKVLVCDGEVAFTGGVGIAEEWTGNARNPGEWRDTHFRVRGPAVDGLRSAFLRNWIECSDNLFDAGVDDFRRMKPVGGSTVQVLWDEDQSGCSTTALIFRLLLQGAESCVRITTAYFTPDESMLEEICATARSGVEVQVLVPGEHADKDLVRWAGADDFESLLAAGVTVMTFDPTMLHAKVMTADSKVAVVGSSNVNSRSLSHDDEVLMVLFDEELVAELDRHFDDDTARSTLVDPADWSERGVLQRLRERAAGVVDDLL